MELVSVYYQRFNIVRKEHNIMQTKEEQLFEFLNSTQLSYERNNMLKYIDKEFPELGMKLKLIKTVDDIHEEVLRHFDEVMAIQRMGDRLGFLLSMYNIPIFYKEAFLDLTKIENAAEQQKRYDWFIMRFKDINPSLADALRGKNCKQIIPVAFQSMIDTNIFFIANTSSVPVVQLIELGLDVNSFIEKSNYGDNPLLLAIAKGYDHVNHDCPYVDLYDPSITFDANDPASAQSKRIFPEIAFAQKDIIDALLKRDDLDVNAKHQHNGMTALHIACLRGDDPKLIERLLEKGADINALDNENKTPMDYLREEYTTTEKLIQQMTAGDFEPAKNIGANKTTEIATYPNPHARAANAFKINNLLMKWPSRNIENSTQPAMK
jgi:ankyrin repeat protein